METEPSDDSPAAAACPRWAMLNRYSFHRPSAAAVTEATSAASYTSIGQLFRVSFLLAAPPACSNFYHDWAGSAGKSVHDPHQIIAADGDCLLLEVRCPDPDRRYDTRVIDFFLYEAVSAARPPSLSLLPACFYPMEWERSGKHRRPGPNARYMGKESTGVLRRGAGEVLVAHLEVPNVEVEESRSGQRWLVRDHAQLCVLHLHTGRLKLKWEINRKVRIVHGEQTAGNAEKLMKSWDTDAAVAVGGRFLCFVDYLRGFLLCDTAGGVAAAGLGLRYVPLPVEPPNGCPSFDGYRSGTHSCRNMAAAGATAVRFVTVESRCCCGGAGDSTCDRGRFLFTVATWTLSLAAGGDDEPTPATWVEDGVLDCEELWAMSGYGSLPRRPLTYPVVSCDDPDVVCFMLRNDYRFGGNREDRKVWMLEIDMRSKALLSVVLYDAEGQEEYQVPAKLQC